VENRNVVNGSRGLHRLIRSQYRDHRPQLIATSLDFSAVYTV